MYLVGLYFSLHFSLPFNILQLNSDRSRSVYLVGFYFSLYSLYLLIFCDLTFKKLNNILRTESHLQMINETQKRNCNKLNIHGPKIMKDTQLSCMCVCIYVFRSFSMHQHPL